MSFFKNIKEKFNFKYFEILSNYNLKKYKKNKYSFIKFFLFYILMLCLNIFGVLVLYTFEGNDQISSLRKLFSLDSHKNKTKLYNYESLEVIKNILNNSNTIKFSSNNRKFSLEKIRILENITLNTINKSINPNQTEVNLKTTENFEMKNYSNLKILQFLLIFLQLILFFAFFVIKFLKFKFKIYIYKLISLSCCINNFLQYEILRLIFNNYQQYAFHSQFTIPYTHTALLIYYSIFIDSDYFIILSSSVISAIVLLVFPVEYGIKNDCYFLIWISFLILFCYFSSTVEVFKRKLFLIKEREKNHLDNKFKLLENLNSGILVLKKDNTFEFNKKFEEFFTCNFFEIKNNKIQNNYLKYILFENLYDFNSNFTNEFIFNLKKYSLTFLEYSKNFSDLNKLLKELRELDENSDISNKDKTDVPINIKNKNEKKFIKHYSEPINDKNIMIQNYDKVNFNGKKFENSSFNLLEKNKKKSLFNSYENFCHENSQIINYDSEEISQKKMILNVSLSELNEKNKNEIINFPTIIKHLTEDFKYKEKRLSKSLYFKIQESENKNIFSINYNNLKVKIKSLEDNLNNLNLDLVDFKNILFSNLESNMYSYFATKQISQEYEIKDYKIFFKYNNLSETLEFICKDISSDSIKEDFKSENKYKKYFLDKFSHEFRNPILNIKQIIKNIKILQINKKNNLNNYYLSNNKDKESEIKEKAINIILDENSNQSQFDIINDTITEGKKDSPKNIQEKILDKEKNKDSIIIQKISLFKKCQESIQSKKGIVDKENTMFELRHIKNLCEYMSLLISDFDVISNISNYTTNLNKTFKTNLLEDENDEEYNPNSMINFVSLEKSQDGIINFKRNSQNLENINCFEKFNNDAIIEKTSFDINKFIKNIVKIFKSKIFLSEKIIDINYKIDNKVPKILYLDSSKIRLILFNLLCNSFKFTFNGNIVIEIEVDSECQNLIINIIDSGIGIKKDNIIKLLKPLQTINLYDNNLGVGMGLYIVRLFLEILGGSIKIESDCGFGTFIELKIPLKITRNNTTYTLFVNEKLPLDDYSFKRQSSLKSLPDKKISIKNLLKYKSFKQRINTCTKQKFGFIEIYYDKTYTEYKNKNFKKKNSINNNLFVKNTNITTGKKEYVNRSLTIPKLDEEIRCQGLKNLTSRSMRSKTTENNTILISDRNLRCNYQDIMSIASENSQSISQFHKLEDVSINCGSFKKNTEKSHNLSINSNMGEFNNLGINKLPTNLSDFSNLSFTNQKINYRQNNLFLPNKDLILKGRVVTQLSSEKLKKYVTFKNGLKILLVDDERLIRQSEKNVMEKYFKEKGIRCKIEECSDGVECLYKIFQGLKYGIKYDLIITDETMNFMKGSTTAEILRSLMKENIMYELKIIMVTSYEISNIALNVKMNLDNVLTKPLSKNKLDLIFK